VHAEFVADIRKYTAPEQDTVLKWSQKKRDRLVSYDESVFTNTTISSVELTQFQPYHLAPLHLTANLEELRKVDYIQYHKMRSHVQVLTTPTADTPGTTLLLHFDNKRYLIGSLAEGTQRAAVEIGARFLKVSNYFITGRSEWSNTGGLIGMILTLADSAKASQVSSADEAERKAYSKAHRLGLIDNPEKKRELVAEALKEVKNHSLSLFGPPNLSYTLATARRFVFRKGMPIQVNEVDGSTPTIDVNEDEPAPYFVDENIKVWAMSISPTPQSRPTTPRKRSIDEVYNGDNTMNGIARKDVTSENHDSGFVNSVVDEMFNSTWAFDTLYETPLSEVKLPATIFIRHQKTNKVEKYHGPLPVGDTPLPDPNLKVLVRRPWPGALVQSLPPTEPAKESISYIVRNHKQRGKFKPEVAKELKVTEGRNWAQLAAGNSVLNDDGETITPDMVLGPGKEGGGFAVVDLPDPSYIQPLIDRPEWCNEKIMTGVGAVVWICDKNVAADPRLHGFMQKFSNMEHLISSPDYCLNGIGFDSAAASTTRLRKVDPERYRVPIHDDQQHDVAPPNGGSDDFHSHSNAQSLPEGVRIARRGHIVQLEPMLDLNEKQIIPPLNIAEVEKRVSRKVLDEAAIAQEATKTCPDQDVAWLSSLPDPEAEIITLGTGSALPSKYRNVSSTLVRVPGWGSLLFDCGENTLGQLKRVFSREELKQVLEELKLIFISHMHADHHLGTASVIKAWYEEVHGCRPAPAVPADADKEAATFEHGPRLAIISEPAMVHWLAEYAAVEDYGYSRLAPLIISPARPHKEERSQLIWFVAPSEQSQLSRPEAKTYVVPPSTLGLADIQAVQVRHCHGARAVSITLPSGFKASYSGDCRPTLSFTQIGKGSTICVHEATFDDELQGDAEAKQHSTTSEALGVAQAMGAKACVLTHFSQRYQKIPVLERGVAGEQNGQDALPEAEDAEDDDAEMGGPLEDDMAPTVPDPTANANGTPTGTGEKFELPSKSSKKAYPFQPASGPPAAVKFKLNSDMKVCVAFDYMRVKVKDMWKMEKFTPALLELFAEEDKSEANSLAGDGSPKKGKAKGSGGKQKQKQGKKKDEAGNDARNQPEAAGNVSK
jgi:ribonuclease Z